MVALGIALSGVEVGLVVDPGVGVGDVVGVFDGDGVGVTGEEETVKLTILLLTPLTSTHRVQLPIDIPRT